MAREPRAIAPWSLACNPPRPEDGDEAKRKADSLGPGRLHLGAAAGRKHPPRAARAGRRAHQPEGRARALPRPGHGLPRLPYAEEDGAERARARLLAGA